MQADPPIAPPSCPCGYALTGLTSRRCPECGATVDLNAVGPTLPFGFTPRRWFLFRFAALASALVGPSAWIVTLGPPWQSHQLYWLLMAPGLPLLILTIPLRRVVSDSITLVAMYVGTILLLMILMRITRRGLRWLIIVALVVLALSSLNSFIAHALYAA